MKEWEILDEFSSDVININNIYITKDFIKDKLDSFEIHMIHSLIRGVIPKEETIIYTKDNNIIKIRSFDVYDTPTKEQYSPFNLLGQMVYNRQKKEETLL